MTINSNLIVHLSENDNIFNYNANYRNSNIGVEVILSHINYQNQNKTIYFNFKEEQFGDITNNIDNINLILSNKDLVIYNLYEVYCNNKEFDSLIYSASYPNSIEEFLKFDNCNIIIEPNFINSNYDINTVQIKFQC